MLKASLAAATQPKEELSLKLGQHLISQDLEWQSLGSGIPPTWGLEMGLHQSLNHHSLKAHSGTSLAVATPSTS